MRALEEIRKAKKFGYAIGAFNAANTETLKAIVQAAQKMHVPVIIEASEGEVNYIGVKQLVALTRIHSEEAGIPIITNLDHSKSFDACKEAIDAGFDYVHFDGSKLPLEENVKIARRVVEYAHEHGVMVEAEMDHIQGSSADHTQQDPDELMRDEFYTNPERAAEFVDKTGIDVLASFIGNMHGVYSKKMRLRIDLLEKLTKMIPNIYFSLHGGSGLDENDVKAAIKAGIVKVNVNSEMRIAFKAALKEAISQTDEIAIYKITPPAIEAVQKIVEKKIVLFSGKRDKTTSII